ncbi:type II toxin-antitoxin system VapB family antitoxin [Sphaerimonospora cavernae]|uniref:Type II toxin-antitoxin system VapB family antitoxin n=1 Tax=Sphaerimonospora cavernae TaxID=1740611 RepID=A0ABV6U2N4_9ACTN
MKTTVDIADVLLQEAREMARHEGTTLKALIEEGLRSVLSLRSGRASFKLTDASVDGEGLQPGMGLASWEEIRALAYGDRL